MLEINSEHFLWAECAKNYLCIKRALSRCQSRSFQKRVYRAIVYLSPKQFQASPKDLSNNMLKGNVRINFWLTAPINFSISRRDSNSLRVRVASGTTCVEANKRGWICAPNKSFIITKQDITFSNGHTSCAQRFDFPTLQRKSCFKFFFNKNNRGVHVYSVQLFRPYFF